MNDVESQFRADLRALLDKYGAELEAKDHYQGYAECGENIRMTATLPAIYSTNGDCLRELVEIDLGQLIWASKKTGEAEAILEEERLQDNSQFGVGA